MSEQENIMVGLDIGTTKICAIVASIEHERINILGVGKAPSDGLNRGVVVNIDKTVNAIKDAIAQADSGEFCECRYRRRSHSKYEKQRCDHH